MFSKNIIIILIILFIVGFLFLGYFYYYTQKYSVVPINKINKKTITNNKNSQKEAKESNPEEIKQRIIEKTETLESIKRKQEVGSMTPKELKELKERLINKAK